MILNVHFQDGTIIQMEPHDELFKARVVEAQVSWLDLVGHEYLSFMQPERGNCLRLTVFTKSDAGPYSRQTGTDPVVSPTVVVRVDEIFI